MLNKAENNKKKFGVLFVGLSLAHKILSYHLLLLNIVSDIVQLSTFM